MKIAFVGKGGSGKSSVSWLFSQYVAQRDGYVALIDSDHNMDLTALMKFDFNQESSSFHRLHDEFRKYVNQKEDKGWSNIVCDGRELPEFKLLPEKDEFSKKVFNKISDSIDLAVVGLGSDDLLYSDRCAHGHSAPLKYYLPLLKAEDYFVVIDGVAGADMLNAGVYNGVDLICVVVEPQPNSMRVCEQIITLAQIIGLPYCVVLNKPNTSHYQDEIMKKYSDVLAGIIPLDIEIVKANYGSVSEEVKNNLNEVYSYIEKNFDTHETLSRVRNFEMKKKELRA